MKVFKKCLSAVMTSLTIMASLPVASSYAAPAPSTDPQFYIDFTVEADGKIRGDVMLANVPNLSAIGFHINLGDGFEFVPLPDDPGYYTEIKTQFHGAYADALIDDQRLFFAGASVTSENVNGHFLSFYVERTAQSTDYNSTGEIEFVSGGLDGIYDNGSYIYNPPHIIIPIDTPPILESGEFIYGDADDDGYVDASDAGRIMSAISENGGAISIASFTESTLTYLPTYRTAFAADVNTDGYISNDDVSAILNYYVTIGAGTPYTGNINTVDIYEIY